MKLAEMFICGLFSSLVASSSGEELIFPIRDAKSDISRVIRLTNSSATVITFKVSAKLLIQDLPATVDRIVVFS